jgi:hypothetical protein
LRDDAHGDDKKIISAHALVTQLATLFNFRSKIRCS